jgi:hypothetical protein
MTLARAFKRTALPLACYYGITIFQPVANGAAMGAAFARHAAVVVAVPPILIVLAWGGREILRAFARLR